MKKYDLNLDWIKKPANKNEIIFRIAENLRIILEEMASYEICNPEIMFELATEMTLVNLVDKALFKEFPNRYFSLMEPSFYKDDKKGNRHIGRPDLIFGCDNNEMFILEAKYQGIWNGKIKEKDYELKETYKNISDQLLKYTDQSASIIKVKKYRKILLSFQWINNIDDNIFKNSTNDYKKMMDEKDILTEYSFQIYQKTPEGSIFGWWIYGRFSTI